MKEAHALTSLLLEDFTEKRLSFAAYAEYATEKLGFSVTPQHVKLRVSEFEIPLGREEATPELATLATQVLAHAQQIADLTERMATLEAWVNTTFPSKGPRLTVAQ